MMLVYILFALTLSTVLSALFSRRSPENRKGDGFIGFFIALLLLAWAMDAWLLPLLAANRGISWPGVTALVVFGAILVSSFALSVRTPRFLKQAALTGHEHRFDAEATAFDLLLWLVLVTLGIILIRSIGI